MITEQAWYKLSPERTYEIYQDLLEELGNVRWELDEAREVANA